MPIISGKYFHYESSEVKLIFISYKQVAGVDITGIYREYQC